MPYFLLCNVPHMHVSLQHLTSATQESRQTGSMDLQQDIKMSDLKLAIMQHAMFAELSQSKCTDLIAIGI